MTLAFNSTDSLILFAISIGQGVFKKGITHTDIIFTGDAFDRTIFSYGELESSFQKLLTIKFIKIENEKIYLTKEFKLVEKLNCKKTSSAQKTIEEFKKLLQKYNNTETDKLADLPQGFLTDDTLDIAIKTYRLK